MPPQDPRHNSGDTHSIRAIVGFRAAFLRLEDTLF